MDIFLHGKYLGNCWIDNGHTVYNYFHAEKGVLLFKFIEARKV